MDEKVEITVQLISKISGLLTQGEDPKPLFSKENEKSIATKIYEKYETTRGGCSVVIYFIYDEHIKFTKFFKNVARTNALL